LACSFGITEELPDGDDDDGGDDDDDDDDDDDAVRHRNM
jgi:hypothetical protein